LQQSEQSYYEKLRTSQGNERNREACYYWYRTVTVIFELREMQINRSKKISTCGK